MGVWSSSDGLQRLRPSRDRDRDRDRDRQKQRQSVLAGPLLSSHSVQTASFRVVSSSGLWHPSQSRHARRHQLCQCESRGKVLQKTGDSSDGRGAPTNDRGSRSPQAQHLKNHWTARGASRNRCRDRRQRPPPKTAAEAADAVGGEPREKLCV